MNSIRSYQQALALALPVTCLLTAPASAQSTWVGTTSADWATATNWVPGVPGPGVGVIVADATTNSTANLDTPRSIGLLTFGTSGTRITNFTINTQAANQLTVAGGVNAGGAWPTNAALTLRGHYIVSAPQTWTVGGSGAHASDQGVFIREVAAGVTNRGSLTLDGDLTKSGTGQLLFAAIDIGGTGNLIVNAGGVKLNAGANQPLVIAGSGNITVNNSATLAAYKNSGTLSLTRPVVMNNTSSLIARNSPVDIASTITFNGTPTLDAGGLTNLSGPLAGAGTINRIGGGILNLSGDGSGFSGSLNTSTGTTNLLNTFGGNLSVAGGNLGGESTITGLTTVNGGTLLIDASTPEALTAGGGLTLSGSNPISLIKMPSVGSPFTVLQYGGTLTGTVANLSIPGTRTPNLVDTGSAITATIGNETRTWTGSDVTVAWDIGVTSNWQEGDQKYFQGDAVTFGNTGAGTVPITGVLNPSSITIQNDLGNDYLFTAAAGNLITGATSITKSGGGTATLQGVNSFTGGVTINSGIFKAGGNQSLGANGNLITVNDGGTFDTNGSMNANRDYEAVIAGTGGGGGAIINTAGNHNNGFRSLTLTDDATIGGTGRWDLRPITAGTVLLDLDGNTLTKIGTNFIAVVDGEITSSGVINVNEGTFAVTRCVVNGTDNVNVNSGATLLLENYNTGSFNRPIALNGSTLRNQGTTFTLGSNVSISGNSLISVGSGVTFTIPTPLTGTGNLEKTDTGTLLLAADNSYTGTTTVSAGNLTITGDNSDADDTFINNGILAVGTGGTTGEINTNPITLGSTTAGIRFNRSDDITITNVISGSGITGNDMNPSAINKDGANTLTLSAANTYTGTFRLNGGTVVIASDASVFGDPSALIDLRGNAVSGFRSSDASPRTIPNPISYSNTTSWGSPGTGKLTLSGPIAYGGASKTIFVNNDEMEISGVIAGTGVGTNLTKDGPGTLILSGNNTYTQNTVVNQGILQIGNGGTTGTFGSGAVTNNASLVIHRSLPEEVTELNIGNLISGTGTLTHSGPAFTILSAANTYTGDTIINDGTLSPSFAFFADTAAVRLSGDGTVDLFHAATDVIDRLYIDGVAQAAGMWGRIGSITELGADFESALITGDGLLSVTNSGSPFSEWAGDQGLTAGIDGEGDDPDQDGQDNLTEFALDGNPQSGASSGKVVGRIATVGGEQVLTLTLPVRTTVGAFSGANALSAAGDGVTYTIEGSDDLGSWLLDIDEVTGPDAAAIQAGLPALSSGDWTYRTFRSPGPVAGDPSDFLRARIE
jgi:autotransporter-associated beta strand protein